MFYRVQKGVKKGALAGSVSGCGGGCGFPQPLCRTRTGVAVSRRCRAVPLSRCSAAVPLRGLVWAAVLLRRRRVSPTCRGGALRAVN